MKRWWITGIVVGVLAPMAWLGASHAPDVKAVEGSLTYQQLNLFADVFERTRASYVDEPSDEELIDAAISGMLSSLDPHSSYLNPEHFRDMQVQTRGEFGGLGIEVTMENGIVKVVAPIDDTPAQRAGLMSGDLITHLDGTSIVGVTLSEAVEQMRGPPGASLELTVVRAGENEPLKIPVVRDIIRIRSVKHQRDGDVGYIRITTFSDHTSDNLRGAISDLKADLGADAAGYVLDLRNNPGGLLDEAVSVSGVFLDRGEVVSTRGRHPDDIQRYNARAGDLLDGRPLLVLINGGSASASEIVAGALQDHRRAVILGTRSFGKGSVQTIVPLGAEGAIRLTTARYYTPSGRSIQALGVEPDITVEQDSESETASRVTGESTLRGHLEGEDDEEANGEEEEEVRSGSASFVPEERADDVQLNYALDLLNGVKANGAPSTVAN